MAQQIAIHRLFLKIVPSRSACPIVVLSWLLEPLSWRHGREEISRALLSALVSIFVRWSRRIAKLLRPRHLLCVMGESGLQSKTLLVMLVFVLVAATAPTGHAQEDVPDDVFYEVDKSDDEQWKIHSVDCARISKIRVHTDPEKWAPNVTHSCYKATGNQRIGVSPGQWVMIQLNDGTWALLADADRRP